MAMALAMLQASMRECCDCAALVKCRSRVVPGDGAVPARVMFVGIAPGRFGGDLTGIPFSGDRSGILLRGMIASAGIEDAFITNLVRCNPRDERGRIAIRAPPKSTIVANTSKLRSRWCNRASLYASARWRGVSSPVVMRHSFPLVRRSRNAAERRYIRCIIRAT